MAETDRRGYGAQEHLEWPDEMAEAAYGGELAEKQRMEAHVPEMKAHPFPVDWGNRDVTVTVDPLRPGHWWIRDASGRHGAANQKGELKDYQSVMSAMGAFASQEGYSAGMPGPREPFMPTSAMLDRAPKFMSNTCVANSTRGVAMGMGVKGGTLPIIQQLIWDNELPDRTDWLVNRDVWDTHRYPRDRTFDCRGTCR